ncbi:MAG: type II secretion system protein, partial [Phycisphaerae bacterium]|nr:type II secretion system protein [Phycisphaerae bacterium]
MSEKSRVNQCLCGKKGFTLAELLIALMITSLILGAVAAIAHAMSSANDKAQISGEAQAQVRFTSHRINEMIKFSRLVFDIPGEGIALWINDDGYSGFGEGDDKVNPAELIFLRFNNNDLEYIKYSPTYSSESWFEQKEFTVTELQGGLAQTLLDSQCDKTAITIV